MRYFCILQGDPGRDGDNGSPGAGGEKGPAGDPGPPGPRGNAVSNHLWMHVNMHLNNVRIYSGIWIKDIYKGIRSVCVCVCASGVGRGWYLKAFNIQKYCASLLMFSLVQTCCFWSTYLLDWFSASEVYTQFPAEFTSVLAFPPCPPLGPPWFTRTKRTSRSPRKRRSWWCWWPAWSSWPSWF